MKNEDYPEDDEMDEEYEFWLFTGNVPLPSLDEIKQVMEKEYPAFVLNSRGPIEKLKDGMATGMIVSPDGKADQQAEGIETAWMVEPVDARRFFARAPQILRDLGKHPRMLRISVPDLYSLGHGLSMLNALLTLQDGTLSIPSPDGPDVMVLNRREALEMLKEQLNEFSDEIIEELD